MVVAGIDVGSVTTKAVILAEEILSTSICASGVNPKLAASQVMALALKQAGVAREALSYIVSTGYGRRAIEFGHHVITEISACAQGARWLGTPSGAIRTIIDLGGQDMKVISLEENGDVADFVMNDKCAAGTGRFLEVMADTLGVGLENLGKLSLKSSSPLPINSTCTVFAETEVVSLIAQGRSKEDIIAGLHASIAKRIVQMLKEVGEKETIFFCGGGAKNWGIQAALEEQLAKKVYVPPQPQFVIALGAALIARESVR